MFYATKFGVVCYTATGNQNPHLYFLKSNKRGQIPNLLGLSGYSILVVLWEVLS